MRTCSTPCSLEDALMFQDPTQSLRSGTDPAAATACERLTGECGRERSTRHRSSAQSRNLERAGGSALQPVIRLVGRQGRGRVRAGAQHWRKSSAWSRNLTSHGSSWSAIRLQ